MIPNLLIILWFLIPICYLIAGLMAYPSADETLRWALLTVGLLLMLCWSYLSIRTIGFRKRLFNFFRLLLAGDYDAGMRTRTRFTDEISRLEGMGNQLSERLRIYDRLRADRVAIHARVLDLILRQTTDLFITADSEKEIFTFNPATQKLLGISRKSYSFESLLKVKTNETFAALFKQAVSGRKINTEGSCALQLPGMSAPARLMLLMMPLRDRDENVRYTLISIETKAPQTS